MSGERLTMMQAEVLRIMRTHGAGENALPGTEISRLGGHVSYWAMSKLPALAKKSLVARAGFAGREQCWWLLNQGRAALARHDKGMGQEEGT